MRTALSGLAALALVLTGCSFSSVDPDAPVHISGRALDASGKPLAGAKVLLVKQADIGEVLFGAALVVGTLSTICLLPEPPALCSKARQTTTDAEGRYEFDLEGADTQGTLGTESTLNVVFSAGQTRGGGTSTTLSFAVKAGEVSLPDARVVRLAPRVSTGAGRIRVAWSSLPRRAGEDPTYSAQLYEGDSQFALWSQSGSGDGTSIDARVFEDKAGAVAVGASASLEGGLGTGGVRASYLSQQLPLRGTAGAPPSRGRRCAPVTGSAEPKDGAFAACAATDGNLSEPSRLTAKNLVTGVAVDLGGRRPVRLVVARGFGGQLLIEVSDDGRRYRTVATISGSAVAAEPPPGTIARYVRLRSPAGLDESLGSELSVW